MTLCILSLALAPACKRGGGSSGSKADDRGPADAGGLVQTDDSGVPGPRISEVTLDPKKPTVRDEITTEVAVHPSTGIELDYAWFINGSEDMREDRDSLSAHRAAKGDRVKVRVTARNEDGGITVYDSAEVTLVNSPPEITSYPSDDVRGFVFEAEDPDGDALTWSLEGAPPGWSISGRGELQAPEAPPPPGSYNMKVLATDPDGEASVYEVDMEIEEAKEAAAEPTPKPEVRKRVEDMDDEELDAFQQEFEKKLDEMTARELEEFTKKWEEKLREKEQEGGSGY
jgi:hypothetical protein